MNEKSYQDIIHLKKPLSKHPKMPISNRAAQFSPFAALSGYEEAIKEKEKTFEKKKLLSQESTDSLNEILLFLKEKKIQDFTLCYFQMDESKKGGSYKTVHATSVKFLEIEKSLLINNQLRISFSDIYSIHCEEYQSSNEES